MEHLKAVKIPKIDDIPKEEQTPVVWLCQHYQSHVVQPLLLEYLFEMEIDISSGQLSNIITEGHDTFHDEKDAVLKTKHSVLEHINVGDTGSLFGYAMLG